MTGVPSAETLEKYQERAVSPEADAEAVIKVDGGMTGFAAEMKFTDGGSVVGFRLNPSI